MAMGRADKLSAVAAAARGTAKVGGGAADARLYFYGPDTGLCNHWPFALEQTPSFYAIHFIKW